MTEAAFDSFTKARENYFNIQETKMKEFILRHPEMSDEDVTLAMMKEIWDISPKEPREIDNCWCLNLDFTKRVRGS